jgi:uncharacterized protein YndB with AHSA1/START domain
MRVSKETVVNAPPEKVFEYLSDLTKHAEWATPGHGLKVERVSDGATAVGSQFKSEAHQFGAQHDTITVTEMQPNQRLVYEVVTKDNEKFRWGFQLSPTGGGTNVTRTMETVKTGLMTKMMTPMLAVMAPRLLAGDLERIKARLQ